MSYEIETWLSANVDPGVQANVLCVLVAAMILSGITAFLFRAFAEPTDE